MARTLKVSIVGDTSDLERAFQRAGVQTKNFGGNLAKFGKAAAFTAGGAAVGGLIVALKRGTDEFKSSQLAAAATRAALKSTGGAAGVSAKHIDKLAQSLSNMSGIDDEVIQGGENLLLTFTNIQNKVGKGNKIFDRATKTILDMSVGLGQDTKTSAIQLGKALNDPIKGVTALRRVGVSFNADQLKQIDTLVKSGKTMQAQKLILRELSVEFGGRAKAAGDSFSGSMHKLTNTFDNLAGKIVGAAAPSIQKYVDKLNVWLSNSENQERVQRAVAKAVKGVSAVVKDLTGFVRTIAPIVQKLVGFFGGWKRVLEGLVLLKVASWMSGVAGGILRVGGNAAGAKGAVGGLAGVLRKLPKSLTVKLSVVMLGLAAFIEFTRLMDKYFPAKDVGTTPKALNSLPDWAKKQIIPRSSPKVQANAALGVVQKAFDDISKAAGGGRSNSLGRVPLGLSPGPMAVRSLAGGTVISGGTFHFHGVQDVAGFKREMQKEARRQSASRAGPFGGHNLGLA